MLLVTGFDAFGGAATNPTQQLVENIAALGRHDVATCVLPTSYRRSESAVSAVIRQLRPQTVCMLGLHAGATTLRFEQVALNLNQAAKPDNDRETRLRHLIRETGPVAYFSRLPFDEMQQSAQAFGETLDLSRDAGGFVCNHVFYSVSHLLAEELPHSRAGFVHVPPLDGARFDRMVAVLRSWTKLLCAGGEAR